jgi:hypothetical protein
MSTPAGGAFAQRMLLALPYYNPNSAKAKQGAVGASRFGFTKPSTRI